MDGPRSQLLRAAAVAALCGLLTATAHVAGGGALPDVAALVLLLPLLAVALLGVAQRARGALARFGVLAAGQSGLHVLLAVLHPHQDGVVGYGSGMVAAHALATVATAVLLARADAAIAAVVTALRRLVPRRPRTRVPHPAPPVRPVPAPGHPARSLRVHRRARPRRGPPVPC